jgi:predicted RNase H-related nuclease YkuK (DUF458 family)
VSSRIFKKIGSDETVNLLGYVRHVLEKKPSTKIYIGCDSQSYANKTVYVTTVVFRYDNRGAHVIYKKEIVPKVNDLWTKLWGELQRSIDIAGYLKVEGQIEIHQIDLDYNTNPKHKSNVIVKTAIGYMESMGYNYAIKPQTLIAISVANELCR